MERKPTSRRSKIDHIKSIEGAISNDFDPKMIEYEKKKS